MRGSAMIKLTLTETAANKVKELIQRSDPETGQPLGSIEDTYLRMYVAGGGCSGFRYGLALDRKIHEDDEVVQVHGLKVLVDGNSKEYLDGSSVDYAESVAGSGFLVSNPNNWSTCGCGQSFNPKGEEAPDQHEAHPAHAHTHSVACGRPALLSRKDIFVAFMAKAGGLRVETEKAVELDGARVTNKTSNSLLVRRTPEGIEVTDCCLEEQGK